VTMTHFLSATQSVKDMPVVQDGPPPGGFPSVRIARRIPSTGPGGFTVFAISASIMAYGFYLVSASQATFTQIDTRRDVVAQMLLGVAVKYLLRDAALASNTPEHRFTSALFRRTHPGFR